MKCPYCGFDDVDEKDFFCIMCGKPVETENSCSECGIGLPPYARYCPQCGRPTVFEEMGVSVKFSPKDQ